MNNQDSTFIKKLDKTSNYELTKVFCDENLLNEFSLEFFTKLEQQTTPFININGKFGAFTYSFINGKFTFLEDAEIGLGISQKNYNMSEHDSAELFELLCATAYSLPKEVKGSMQIVNSDKIYQNSQQSLGIFNFA